MHIRKPLRFSALAIAAAVVAACSAPAPTLQKTEMLPADGGEVGKAFAELQSALGAGDDAHASKLLDPKWRVNGDGSGYFAVIKTLKPTGGKRQGDRATLFVQDEHYAEFNATHGPSGWYFDLPMPLFLTTDEKTDCIAKPQQFPCGASSAPDSQVSGYVTETQVNHLTNETTLVKEPLFDGFATRVVSNGSKKPTATRLILSATAVNPEVLALNTNPSSVASALNYVLTLDIAPDGKSAHGKYNGFSGRREFDVKDGAGLTLDTTQPKRLHGRVTADVKDAGKLDAMFDVGIASQYEGQ